MENTIKITSSHDQTVINDEIIPMDDGFTLNITITNPGNEIRDFVLKAEIGIFSCRNSYILFPGAVYDGNRADMIKAGPYPPRLDDFKDVCPDGPVINADIPRYNGRLVLQTYDLTMPACGIYQDDKDKGIIVSTDTGPAEAPNGFELYDDKITVSFPCIREKRYRHCSRYDDPEDRGMKITSGESIEFKIEVRYSHAADRPSFAYEMSSVFIKDFKSRQFDHRMLAGLCIDKINRDEYNDTDGFYVDGAESRRFQVGWVSGVISAYTMLLTDHPEYHERAAATLRFVLDKGISPCGLPLGIYDDKGWRGLEYRDRLDFAGMHVRRIYDAVFYMFRILRLGKLDDILEERVKNAALLSCERLSILAGEYGHFGHSINLNDGKIFWGGSAAGVTGISCLCEGYKISGNADWLALAEKAGSYYSRFNDRGSWTGGPGDILMAPDSESNYAAMDAYYLLYEITGKMAWKHEFIRASQLMSTWICMVDHDFPEGSTYGKLGTHTKGLVMANAQNKHLGPGICTSSGSMFKKAYELTGDGRFSIISDMILDAASAMAADFKGNIPEDINAADSMCERGELYTEHGIWTENAYIMMALENYEQS